MTEKFEILISYIKDLSVETPNAETLLFVKDNLKNAELCFLRNKSVIKAFQVYLFQIPIGGCSFLHLNQLDTCMAQIDVLRELNEASLTHPKQHPASISH